MEDLSQWLTIDEAVTVTGKGKRTIERLIEKQQVTVGKDRRQEGKKPVTVISPDSIAKLKAQTLRPVVQSVTPPATQLAKSAARHPDTLAVLRAIEKLLVPLPQKLYLSEREAAHYLGFPHAEVKRLLNSATIPSIRLKNRSRRVRRLDLEAYAYPRLQKPERRITNGIEAIKN